jgi:hypothetical protein
MKIMDLKNYFYECCRLAETMMDLKITFAVKVYRMQDG